MISVVVLTKNEEKDLPMCLASLLWCDDVHVLDSGSTDKTVEIAREYGAKVWINKFESFGKQRNFALDHVELKHEWIFFLDADEVVTESFQKAMHKAVTNADDLIAGYYCCWKMMYEGKWLKYCDNFPKWQFRLMRQGMARFKDVGHGQKEDHVKGLVKYVKEPYLHFSMSKGWHEWYDRHNLYSTLEAKQRLLTPPLRDIFAKHGSVRNPALKAWLSKLALWPVLRFCHAYFYNLGFLEGVPGLIYCLNIAIIEFLTIIKMRELKSLAKLQNSSEQLEIEYKVTSIT